MSIEIERKFLVTSDAWRQQASGSELYRQGYLSTDPDRTVRVRMAGQAGKLTVKGKSSGISRAEFEYDIPATDAKELLVLCKGATIEKTRYRLDYMGKTWEIDVFEGANTGLVLAEIELKSATETFAQPAWVGKEVSDDKRYFNSYLSQHPFSTW